MFEEEEKVGNPWTVLPIKNARYARDCDEVHLSDRNLIDLEDFEDFPNLEVIWLNNNNIKDLFSLTSNFRLKKIYAQRNKISNIEVVKKFNFLETLLVSDNQLKDLDYQLAILHKLTFLEQLDLFGNPVAEEPNYRLRVISAMPKIKILDRHMITTQERIKAKKFEKSQKEPITIKEKKVKKIKKKIKVSECFSKGEKDLYAEVKKIGHYVKEKEAGEIAAYSTEVQRLRAIPAPTATSVTNNKDKFGKNSTNMISEWEKRNLKTQFEKYDKDKTGINVTEFANFLEDIRLDKGLIGKVPNLAPGEYGNISGSLGDNIKWETVEEVASAWEWRLDDEEHMQTRIDEFYHQAYRQKMLGNKDKARELTLNALQLYGTYTRSQPIEIKEREKALGVKREDIYGIRIPAHKMDEDLFASSLVNGTNVVTWSRFTMDKQHTNLGEPRLIKK